MVCNNDKNNKCASAISSGPQKPKPHMQLLWDKWTTLTQHTRLRFLILFGSHSYLSSRPRGFIKFACVTLFIRSIMLIASVANVDDDVFICARLRDGFTILPLTPAGAHALWHRAQLLIFCISLWIISKFILGSRFRFRAIVKIFHDSWFDFVELLSLMKS